MRHIGLGFILGFLIGCVLAANSETRRFNVEIINIEAGQDVGRGARMGLRALRRNLPYRFRVSQVRSIRDESPSRYALEKRVDWYEDRLAARGKNRIVMAFFHRRWKNDYGLARICSSGRRIAFAGITQETPVLLLKLLTAHEIGHTLGAYHHEPLHWEFDDRPKVSIMFPFWDEFFRAIELDRAMWGFYKKSRFQIRECLKFFGSTKSEWVM